MGTDSGPGCVNWAAALDCYVTYADVIAETKIHDVFGEDVHFEIFGEDHKPPLKDHFDGLQDGRQRLVTSDYRNAEGGPPPGA